MSTVEQFEYVFLGGGKGGKTLAMELARSGKRVAVVEEGMIGGSCINVACIPSKALIQTARIMHAVQSADILRGAAPDAKVDMTQVHRRVAEEIAVWTGDEGPSERPDGNRRCRPRAGGGGKPLREHRLRTLP